YIGGGQIVYASNPRTGITVTNSTYRQILAIRRIFN
ncbi:MAG: peptidoglycan endopeptidase, partial [Lachnospiraceae bacterium]|nr:peptidoglycan endopeptidase [Lachnospiraceae bacterium]